MNRINGDDYTVRNFHTTAAYNVGQFYAPGALKDKDKDKFVPVLNELSLHEGLSIA
jgi:hypothetical protein